MRQQNKNKPYSHSLKHLLAAEPKRNQLSTARHKQEHHNKEELKSSLHELQQSRKKYDHQIDHLVREMAQQQGLTVQLPFLQRKSSYHNYRILSHRQQQTYQHHKEEEGDDWRRQVLPEILKAGRTKTEPRQLSLSKQRDKVYSILKHYRQGGLKKMDLHLNIQQLRHWHQKNRKIALSREAQAYKLRKQQFHQLQLHC